MSKNIKMNKIEVIENNIMLVEIIFYIFQNQVLQLDLKEFCLKNKIYVNENQFNFAIKNLINSNVIKVVKLINTDNNVIVSKAIVHRFFNDKERNTKYSTSKVIQNSYINYILVTNHTLLDKNITIEQYTYALKNASTYLSKKRDVESCYKAFLYNNTLNELGQSLFNQDLKRENKRKKHLKNFKSDEFIEEDDLIIYKDTIQTLREKDIYIRFKSKNIVVSIVDVNSRIMLNTLAKKIATTLIVLEEQTNIKKNIQFIVYLRDESSRKRLKNSFITKYKDSEKINIEESINEYIKKYSKTIDLKYTLEEIKDDRYIFSNSYYSSSFQKISIALINTNLASRHNSNLKAQALIEFNENKKEQKIKDELIKELKDNNLLKDNITTNQLNSILNKIKNK